MLIPSQRLLKNPLWRFTVCGVFLFAVVATFNAAFNADSIDDDRILSISTTEIDRIKDQYPNGSGPLFEAALRQHLDDDILFREGFERLYSMGDAVIVDRLQRNMQFVAGSTVINPATQLHNADAMGMAENDPVVRRRVIHLTRLRLLSQKLEKNGLTQAQLTKHIMANREQYLLPETFSLTQLYINPKTHGENLENTLTQTAERLRSKALNKVESDPSMLPKDIVNMTAQQIERQFGASFAEFIRQSKHKPDDNRWLGPINSPYGWHFVNIKNYNAAKLPELARIYNKVYLSLKNEHETKLWYKTLSELRTQYYVQLHGETFSAKRFPQQYTERLL